ncbi:hypothetical protein [Niabella ginsenosidivorans]|uniref:hypothetical protein n=1 Tax=Niabella ginsenosidivorans TaxID=1176587 RepID=UPI0012EEAD4A|nr:hypothetical protein [Niabella ginsenosidivorans]
MTTIYGQGKQDKNLTLTQIKNMFHQINDYKNYKTVTIVDAEEFLGHGTDNGGSLTGYFKNDTLKKIIEWVGLSNKVIQNEYYLDKGKLIFVYSTESRYKYNDGTQSFDYSKLNIVFKGRYYFNNDKLIDTILSDKQHIDTKQEDATDFLTSTKDYLKLLSAKRK